MMRDRSKLAPAVRDMIRKTLGAEKSPTVFVPCADGSPAPVLHDEIAVQKFVEQDCGADGWAIVKGKLVAWRDNGDGSKSTIKTYDVSPYGTG